MLFIVSDFNKSNTLCVSRDWLSGCWEFRDATEFCFMWPMRLQLWQETALGCLHSAVSWFASPHAWQYLFTWISLSVWSNCLAFAWYSETAGSRFLGGGLDLVPRGSGAGSRHPPHALQTTAVPAGRTAGTGATSSCHDRDLRATVRFVVWFHTEPAALLMSSFPAVCSDRPTGFVSLRVSGAVLIGVGRQ